MPEAPRNPARHPGPPSSRGAGSSARLAVAARLRGLRGPPLRPPLGGGACSPQGCAAGVAGEGSVEDLQRCPGRPHRSVTPQDARCLRPAGHRGGDGADNRDPLRQKRRPVTEVVGVDRTHSCHQRGRGVPRIVDAPGSQAVASRVSRARSAMSIPSARTSTCEGGATRRRTASFASAGEWRGCALSHVSAAWTSLRIPAVVHVARSPRRARSTRTRASAWRGSPESRAPMKTPASIRARAGSEPPHLAAFTASFHPSGTRPSSSGRGLRTGRGWRNFIGLPQARAE